MDVNELKLRKRFVSDMNLPITILEDPYFIYQVELYNDIYESLDKWNQLRNVIKNTFNDNPALFLEEYSKVRDKMIMDIKESDAYKVYNNCDMNQFSIRDSKFVNTPFSNIYKETNDEKLFVSFDMRKANFQVMRYMRIISEEYYEDYVSKYTNLKYIKESKYTRQVVFGNLNPKRQVTIEKYIMVRILEYINENLMNISDKFNLVSLSNDEFVYEFNGTLGELTKLVYDNNLDGYEKYYVDGVKIPVKISPFVLKLLKYKTYNNKSLECYVKVDLNRNNFTFKSVPSYYFPQVYKDFFCLEVTKDDLAFQMEGQLAFFDKPLYRVNKPLQALIPIGTDLEGKYNWEIDEFGDNDDDKFICLYERNEDGSNGELISKKFLSTVVNFGKERLIGK